MVNIEQVIKEITDETVKIYHQYPQLNIWESINIAKTVVKEKYKGVEISG